MKKIIFKRIKEKPSKKLIFTFLKNLKIKGGLFRRLVINFTLLSLFTLSVSAALTYVVTKKKFL